MENNLQIKQTAYPDGTVVKYLYGMAKPEVKNLGQLMKEAVYEYLLQERKVPTAKFAFTNELSKAG